MDGEVTIAAEDPGGADAAALLAAGDAYAASLYPAESNHMLGRGELRRPGTTFLVARDGEGRALGCAALVRSGDGKAEIKRMFVAPEARGCGVGRRLLAAIEREAGGMVLRLETGVRQEEAIALYRSAGFVETGPFGSYAADPLSVFMEKKRPGGGAA